MATPDFLRRRTTTSEPRTSDQHSPGPGLPSDVLLQTCRRVGAVGSAFAAIWILAILMFAVIGPRVAMMSFYMDPWPMPGGAIAGVGLVVSLVLTSLAGRLSAKPELLMDVGSVFLVITCFLFALLEYWTGRFDIPHGQWIGISILAYSSIVPNAPGTTLRVGLLAATTAPLAFIVCRMAGVESQPTPFLLFIAFLPGYVCAALAVIPAKVIRRLSQQVRRARELGSYRLEEILGKGGMGEVYKASHQMLARPAAVKLIRAEVLGGSDPGQARVIIERFRREAEAAASLRSPHTISLYDFGVASDGTFFFVMELLDGLDLESLVKKFGPLDPARAVYLLAQVCRSLEEAHSRGMIHRDIKPSNIFTCRLGLDVDFVKVLDFGLVKDEGQTDVKLTAPDHTAGTPAYIAPETVLGSGPVDHRADLYSLGCVAYWLLTGRLVFEAPNAIQMMFQHASAEPVPPSERSELEIPAALERVIMECLAKKPEHRPQDAGILARRLHESVTGDAWSAERALRWWQRHRPELAHPEPTCCDGLTLNKAMGEGWDAESDPKPALAGPRA